jgi:hypothetical protein
VPGLHDDTHPVRVQRVVEGLGDLLRQPLLHLKSAAEHFNNARYLAQADDLPVRDIRDMRPAEEWQHVVFAQAEKIDLLDDHHLAISFIENGAVQDFRHILAVAFREKLIGFCDTVRSLQESLPFRVLPQRGQDLRDEPFQRVPFHKKFFHAITLPGIRRCCFGIRTA